MFNPSGLGGSLQFSLTKSLPLRTSSVIVDMAGPYNILCEKKKCTSKIWLLLILNAATQFLEIEILDSQSTASVISALIKYMSHHGSKNIFLSDMGSNFWPLANRIATPPEKELPSLPPFWCKLLTKDLEILQKHGGYIWLVFSKGRHEAVSRVEIMVNKMKTYLQKSWHIGTLQNW